MSLCAENEEQGLYSPCHLLAAGHVRGPVRLLRLRVWGLEFGVWGLGFSGWESDLSCGLELWQDLLNVEKIQQGPTQCSFLYGNGFRTWGLAFNLGCSRSMASRTVASRCNPEQTHHFKGISSLSVGTRDWHIVPAMHQRKKELSRSVSGCFFLRSFPVPPLKHCTVGQPHSNPDTSCQQKRSCCQMS